MPKPPPKTKKQLRKEEIERKKEEERVRQEQEKERLAKEEEKRKELERLKKIEEEKWAKEESERLNEEMKNEVENWDHTTKGNSYLQEKKMKENEDWNKYITCDIKHDSCKEYDLNTFITEFREFKKCKTEKEIQFELMKKAQEAETLAKDLLDIYMKSKADNIFEKELWCLNYIKLLHEITSAKFDEITSYLAINADVLLEENQAKMEKEKKDNLAKSFKQDDKQKQEIMKLYPDYKDYRYGLWINPNSKTVFRHKPLDFTTLGIQCEVPRTLMSNHLIMKVLWTSYDALSSFDIYSKDMVVGGVLDIECFQFLPQPKKANNWILKYDYEVKDALKKHHYPALDSTNYQNATPVKVFYTLPSYVFIHQNDKIRIAVWDKSAGWTTENIDEVKYNPDKKLLTFLTSKLSPLAYIQERCIEYPYLNWKLRCISDDTALIDITGKRQVIRFEIGPGYAILRHKNEPELAHLSNKKMSPGTLLAVQFFDIVKLIKFIKELSKCGIHLLPIEKDASTANINYKNQEAEALAIQDVCFAVRSFFVKSSRWNHIINSEKIMVRLRENPECDEDFAEDQEKDWKTFVWWKNKVGCIKMRDSYENLNETLLDGTLTHARLFILLKKHNLTSTEMIDRFKDTQYIIFNDTLKRFLKLTKLLSFTFE